MREKNTTLFVTFTDRVNKGLSDTIADNVIVYIFVFDVKGEPEIDLLWRAEREIVNTGEVLGDTEMDGEIVDTGEVLDDPDIDFAIDRVANTIERVDKGLGDTLLEIKTDDDNEGLPDVDLEKKDDDETRPLRELLDDSVGIALMEADIEFDPDTLAELLADTVGLIVAETLIVGESQWEAVWEMVAKVDEDTELLPDGEFVTRADRVDVPVTDMQTELDGEIEILDENDTIDVVEAEDKTDVDNRDVKDVVVETVSDALNAGLCDELGQNDPGIELDGEFVVLILDDDDWEPDMLLVNNTETDA